MKKFFTDKYKKINLALLLVSSIILCAIIVFVYLGYCLEFCSYGIKEGLIDPLYSGTKWFSATLVVLLIVPSHIFRRWLFYVAPLPIILTIFLVQNISIYSSGVLHISRGKMAENGMFVLGVVTIIFVVGHLIYDRKNNM
jgi:hypothetical protein